MLNKLFDEFNAINLVKGLKLCWKNVSKSASLIRDELQELELEVERIYAYENKTDVDTFKQDFVKEAIDIIYITGQRLRTMGVDVDAALQEVHRSNTSKALPLDGSVCIETELDIAKARYPMAGVKEGQKRAVLVCGDTNKVIKPTTYSEANITNEIAGI